MTPDLPILQFEEKIITTVNENPVVVIIGKTGSGKSTQLFQILLRNGYTNSGIIALTQPRCGFRIILVTPNCMYLWFFVHISLILTMKVREPCQRLLDSDFGSGQYNHTVRGPVVLDFGNSEVRFASFEPLGTVGHSERYIGRDFGNSNVRSASCKPSNTIGYSKNYIGRGPMVLDFEKCVVHSVGDDTDLVGVEAYNYRNRGGCKVVGSSFVGDYYVDYSRQSGSVWSLADKPKDNTLTGSVPGQDVASR
ncbi:probable pre-mRNA-splicing factor ATP-dependent RNA helicase DEAH4 isoform X1, partial [Tanacetum coccineum]